MWFKYPYTNYSELNLDWFLQQFKELSEAWDAQKVDYEQFKLDVTTEFNTLSGKFDDLKDVVDTFTAFVTNYFDNLDVQQEINNKLDAMAADGSLDILLDPLVASKVPAAVTAWLDDNVDPVGSAVMIDKTLSIASTAADSKVVGDILDAEVVRTTALTGTEVMGRYFTSAGVQGNVADVLGIAIYPVVADTHYILYGEDVKYQINGAGFIGFTTEAYTSLTQVTVLQTTTNVETDYNIDYTPTESGFLWIAFGTNFNKLIPYNTGVESQRIYNLEHPAKTPLKIQLFGDSITDDIRVVGGVETLITTWAQKIEDYMPEYDLTIVNSAVGGSGIGHGKSSTARYSTKTYNYVHDLVTDGTLETDSDIIIMLIGTNNWRGEGGGSYGTLGTQTDDSTSTFYGSANLICKYIAENSDALFVIVTPPQRYNSADASSATDSLGQALNNNDHTLKDFCTALKNVGSVYGYPVIDLNDDLAWNKYNVADFTSDGLHPSAAKCYLIAKYICGQLKGMIGD